MTLIQKIIQEWHTHIKEYSCYSIHTCKSYINDLQHFSKFIQSYSGKTLDLQSFASIDIRSIRSWLSQRKLDKYTNNSNARAISSIKNFYKYLLKYYNINNNIITLIKAPKRPKHLPKALDLEDTALCTNKIIELSNEPWIQARDQALLFLLYAQGLRISEALSITKMHLTSDSLRIIGKGQKDRLVPWLQPTKQLIIQYLNLLPYSLDNQSPIFRGKRGKVLQATVFCRQLTTLRGKLNLPEHTTPHSFRHCFASHLLDEGADLRSIQELLGHRSLSSTQIYTKISTKHLSKVYNSSHPLAKSTSKNDTIE